MQTTTSPAHTALTSRTAHGAADLRTDRRSGSRCGRAALLGLALAVAALGVTGCSTVDEVRGAADRVAETASQAASQAASAAQDGAAPAGSSPQAGSSSEGPAAGGDGLSAAGLCAVLQDTQPALDVAGGEGLAQIILLGEITNAAEEAGAAPDLTALDDLAASCPSDRDAAFGSAGITSFTQL